MKKSVTSIIALCMLSMIAFTQETTTTKASISVRFSPTANFKIKVTTQPVKVHF